MYSVKEIFYSLQGEGAQSGRPAIFVRFAGCNFWTGREEDRSSAICKFCDTDFVGTNGTWGGKYANADSVVDVIKKNWNRSLPAYIIFTGGEPLLQLDQLLIDAIHDQKWLVAVETNGSISAPANIDWICVSPKTPATSLLQTCGDELKLVYPQKGIEPADFEHLDFKHFYIQPMDGLDLKNNTALAVDFCLSNPKWKLSLQNHKYLNIR